MTQNIDKLLRTSGAIIKLQGREYVTFRGLLYVAHQAGLERIDVDLVSWDESSRSAVCKATVTGSRGTFSDYGDASPSNVNRMIANACLRMSSTRSQARALRSYLGVGITTLEELPGDAPARQEAAPAPALDVAAAARYAVKVGKYQSIEAATKACSEVTATASSVEDARKLWRQHCEG